MIEKEVMTYPSSHSRATSLVLGGEVELQSAPEADRLMEELELVGYLASHDLMAPLRRILPCCEILEKQSGSPVDNQGRAALHTITHEALRMKTLMQGLLDYLNMETFTPTHAAVDCNEVVTAAVAGLRADIKSAGAIVTYAALPVVHGHKGRLMRLFASLIDNALKFRGSQPLKINITACPLGKDWEFRVEDNGMGIEEEYSDIIFRLFQRLQETYPGEGIGLALCRKIVESHGGKIGVQSSQGEGCCFHFTLPATA